MSVGSSNSIYDRSRRRCSESVFSWICTGASRGGGTGEGTTTEGRADGEVVGVVVALLLVRTMAKTKTKMMPLERTLAEWLWEIREE